MTTRKLLLLALTIAASLTTSVTSASAFCPDKYRPVAIGQVVPNPDGTKWVTVFMQDKDYQSGGRLDLYENGHPVPLQSNTISGYIRRKMPKGAGLWGFFMGNLTACNETLEMKDAFQVTN